MDDVRFDDQGSDAVRYASVPTASAITRAVMWLSGGSIKTSAAAEKALIAIALTAIVLAIGIFLYFHAPASRSSDIVSPPPGGGILR